MSDERDQFMDGVAVRLPVAAKRCPICQAALGDAPGVVQVPFGRDEGHPRVMVDVHAACAAPERPATPDEQRRDDLLIAVEEVCGKSPSTPAHNGAVFHSFVALDGDVIHGYGPNEVACAAWLLHHVAGHIARKASRT